MDKTTTQETNLGLDMNGTHLVLDYADDVNLIDDDIRTINGNVLLNAYLSVGQISSVSGIPPIKTGWKPCLTNESNINV